MTIWGISDLHLALGRDLSREQFGARWTDHTERIASEWDRVVARGDLVVLPGDVSMARNHREVQPDLQWLARRPGTKVLAPGNHDGWFNRIERVRPMMRAGMRAVRGDAVLTHGVIVCGARGCPAGSEDAKSLAELDRALVSAQALRGAEEPIVVLWHYPPFEETGLAGAAVERLEAAGVGFCVYGHLHTERQWASAVHGLVGSVRYAHVAADAIGFRPLRLMAMGRGS
jgi:predicted phosphohydrolase